MLKRVKQVYAQLEKAELRIVASSLSFSTLLALIPFIAVSLAILQYVGGLDNFYLKVQSYLLSNFKGLLGVDGTKLLQKILKRAASAKIGAIGATALIITSGRLVMDLDRAFHKVFAIKNKRNFVTRLFQYGAALMTVPFALAAYVAVANAKSLDPVITLVPSAFRALVVLFLVLTFAYKTIPSIRVKLASASIGALVGSLGLVIAQSIFGTLTKSVFYYSKLYGSIAAIPVLMIWIMTMWMIILFGAGLTAGLNQELSDEL